MTIAVCYEVVNTNPVELTVSNPKDIDALSPTQCKKLYDELDDFLNLTPVMDKEFFDRIIKQGAVYFYIPSDTQVEVRTKAECAQD